MKADKIDPICGMVGHIPAHGKWFCSQHCVKVYAKQIGVQAENENLWPARLLVGGLILGGVVSIIWQQLMLPFMALVLISLSILKLLDLQGFADAFSMYDILAKRSRVYALVYPFIELALGIAFALQIVIVPAAAVLAVLMIIGIISVLLAQKSGKKFRCACMGTKINVPLTTLTLTEDAVMLVMAAMILF